MSVEVSTALPAVTLDEAKLHLRVESTADDDLISALILACTQMAEHELQRGLVTREGAEGTAILRKPSRRLSGSGFSCMSPITTSTALRRRRGFVAASFCERAA